MSSVPFVHLRTHSQYSLLDSTCTPEDLTQRAAELGQPALALTDHGVMSGLVEHQKACQKHRIKPIFGCELNLASEHPAGDISQLTLLAETDAGYRNLMQLSTAGFLEGLDGETPTVTPEQLAEHADGLIALTGCTSGRIGQLVLESREQEAGAFAEQLVRIFGSGDVYFELQRTGIDGQDQVNASLARIADKLGARVVATGDVRYLRREDHSRHQALLCLRTGGTLAEPALALPSDEFFLQSGDEMAAAFSRWPEAIAATVEIANRCNVKLQLGRTQLPRFLPEGEDEGAYLRDQVLEGLATRYGDPTPAKAVERAQFELDVVDHLGAASYFLIVGDIVRWAKEHGIQVGPGRGSAAGAIINYALGITDVDPLANGLLFERFLNPEGTVLPDIDLDFSVRGRGLVMEYMVARYGRASVAQIATFGRIYPKRAIHDAARLLGCDAATSPRLAALVPDPIMGRPPTFDGCLGRGEPLREAYDDDETARQIIDVARGVEGVICNSSVHAAAIVITAGPLQDLVPLQVNTDFALHKQVTQLSMRPVEELGLLKLDLLALRNLDVIEDTLDLIEQSTGSRPDMATLPLDDEATFAMLGAGDSLGVFQFESSGMQQALQRVAPTDFADLVALVALYRPGAMEQIPDYARGKHAPHSVVFGDERLVEILGPTHGLLLYQEQAMQIAMDLAGFTGAEADDLRKAAGKKQMRQLAEFEPLFRHGCAVNGVAPSTTNWLWHISLKAADYSFNRSHAASYALIAYRTAWLKANHPVGFMAALLASVRNSPDKVRFFLGACADLGIEVMLPDESRTGDGVTAEGGAIRIGPDADPGFLGVIRRTLRFQQIRELLWEQVDHRLADLDPDLLYVDPVPTDTYVTVGGIVTDVQTVRLRSGTVLTLATISDLDGQAELIFIERWGDPDQDLVHANETLVVGGRLTNDGSGPLVMVDTYRRFRPATVGGSAA